MLLSMNLQARRPAQTDQQQKTPRPRTEATNDAPFGSRLQIQISDRISGFSPNDPRESEHHDRTKAYPSPERRVTGSPPTRERCQRNYVKDDSESVFLYDFPVKGMDFSQKRWSWL